jgi:hypothetical protein
MATVYPIDYEICDDENKNQHVIEIFAIPVENENEKPISIYPLVEVKVSPRRYQFNCDSCSCCSAIGKNSCFCLFVSIVSLGGIGLLFH